LHQVGISGQFDLLTLLPSALFQIIHRNMEKGTVNFCFCRSFIVVDAFWWSWRQIQGRKTSCFSFCYIKSGAPLVATVRISVLRTSYFAKIRILCSLISEQSTTTYFNRLFY